MLSRSLKHRGGRGGDGRGLLWLLYTIVAVAFVAIELDQIRRIGDFRVDDAYITFSFSKNLALGRGPLYAHDLKAEGYSNFLWMALVATVHRLGLDLYLGARLLAFGFLAATAYGVHRLVEKRCGRLPAALAVLFLAACSDLTRAALSGLETVAFASCLCLAYSGYLREPRRRTHWSLLWLLPALLLRIDGFVPVAIALGLETLSSILGRRFSFRRLAWIGIPIASAGLLYFAWRYQYYGLPLPSTYYAKSVVAAQDPARGYRQLLEFIEDYGIAYSAPLVLAALLGRHRRPASILLLAVALQAGYAVKVGGDWMPFWRFFQPVVPLFVMLCGLGLGTLLRPTERRPRPPYPSWLYRGLVGPALAAAGFALLGFLAIRVHMGSVDSQAERGKLGHAEHVKKHTLENLLGSVDLARHLVRTPGEKLVSDYAGVFAVFTEANIIDMWGLANPQIARFGGTEGINSIYGKECAACYPSLDPDYFHVVVPLVRTKDAFRSQRAVQNEVFQSRAIGRYLNFRKDFVAGYVLETATNRAFWFLERRRPGRSHKTQSPAPGIQIVYPFEH